MTTVPDPDPKFPGNCMKLKEFEWVCMPHAPPWIRQWTRMNIEILEYIPVGCIPSGI